VDFPNGKRGGVGHEMKAQTESRRRQWKGRFDPLDYQFSTMPVTLSVTIFHAIRSYTPPPRFSRR
jgi:hypothetical protein